MAYARSYKKSYRSARAKPVRRSRRRYVAKRRFAKKRAPIRKMTRRKVMEITSVKKRDHMTGWPSGSAGFGTQILQPGLTTDGHTALLWCPTLRRKAEGNAGPTMSSRERQDVFYKGLSEKFTLKTSGSNLFLIPTIRLLLRLSRRCIGTKNRLIYLNEINVSFQPCYVCLHHFQTWVSVT
ncbi:hypothetical protein [Circular genetic element sp.]|nr:hypothetical protein [Circular genetic element sp.]